MGEKLRIAGVTVEPGKRVMENVKVGTEWNGKPAHIPMILVNGKTSGPILCLNSTIHGTEYTGIVACQRIAREVKPEKLSGAIVALTVSNPLAYDYGTHHVGSSNPWYGFPGSAGGEAGGAGYNSLLCYYLYNEIYLKTNCILDFHGGAEWAYEKFILSCHNDETYKKIGKVADELAKSFGQGLPVIRFMTLGPFAGTLFVHAQNKGIHFFTIEVGGGLHVQQEDVELIVRGLKNMMKYLGMLKGKPELPESSIFDAMKGVDFFAKEGGIWIPEKSVFKLPYKVSKGEQIGRIVDLFGNDLEVMKAPCDGIQDLGSASCKASTGDWLARIEPLPPVA